MENKMITAVEWFLKQSADRPWKEVLEEAKQMHKEQIEKAFNDGYDNGYVDSGKESEQYYNETYQNEKKD